jgi:L-alanine-DL-glutamate epimerase-like enolase superfamily enzyme
LAQETRIPQAVSERLLSKWAFKEILQKQAAHIVMLDVNWTGGLTEALKVAALADAYHLPITPHDCTGPVLVFASLHLCAAVPNAMVLELVRGYIRGYYQEVLTRPFPLREGRAWFDDLGPGLGIQLRPEVRQRKGVLRRCSSH